jgi:hypothetical protein
MARWLGNTTAKRSSFLAWYKGWSHKTSKTSSRNVDEWGLGWGFKDNGFSP